MSLFKELIEEVDLNDAISKYFSGDIINKTEHRSVLHTALRAPQGTDLMLEGVNIIPEVTTVKDKIKSLTNLLDQHEITYGYSKNNNKVKGYNYSANKEIKIDIDKNDLIIKMLVRE